ncbi:MAG: nucleotidyl transferase AbiEii/AbiGii toxin family protein [Pseudobdellovibrio sp.]
MNEAIEQMLKKYSLNSNEDYENALKEILQEIILLALDRNGFFEKAAFYGGTALRIVHGLDRFSEDLDFTLLKPDPNFRLDEYFSGIERELNAFGFEVILQRIDKTEDRKIESAFLKTNTQMLFLKISKNHKFNHTVQKNQMLKIKFEIDVAPATSFDSEIKTLLLPSPYTIKILTLPSLFAGKMHAALFRNWKTRVKGRDFYDVQWYLTQNIKLKLSYLEEKIKSSEHHIQLIDRDKLIELFENKISTVDWSQAKNDVYIFLKDKSQINLWSEDFFKALIQKIQIE